MGFVLPFGFCSFAIIPYAGWSTPVAMVTEPSAPLLPESTTLKLTAGRHAHTARGAAGLQAFIGLLLFFRGNHGLACVAALPDPGSGNELSGAAAALFRHRLLQRENPRFLGQQVGIVEIAMIHVRRLSAINWVCVKTQNQVRPGLRELPELSRF